MNFKIGPGRENLRRSFKQSRLATAVVLVPILYLLIRTLPPFLFFLFTSTIILRVQWEFYQLFYRERPQSPVYVGLASGFLLAYSFYRQSFFLGKTTVPFDLVFISLLIGVLLFHLFFFREIKTTLVDSAVLFLGVAYISGCLSYLISIRQLTDGSALIVFLLMMNWGGDAGAYYVGRSMGRRKLYPTVSPNKTVEGSVGGLIGGFLIGLLARWAFDLPFFLTDLFFLALLVGAFGQLGDLTESMFKRSAGVKDSSALIPAHGGLMDKLDSVAFAAPAFYYYLFWIKGYGGISLGF